MKQNLEKLSGLRVFVVEDEFAVLLLVEDMLAELGCEVAASISRLPEALAAARELACDAAVIDVNINGENVAPLAEVLAARGTPMVFATGYGRGGIDARWRDRPVLQKPYRLEDLAAALLEAAGERA